MPYPVFPDGPRGVRRWHHGAMKLSFKVGAELVLSAGWSVRDSCSVGELTWRGRRSARAWAGPGIPVLARPCEAVSAE